jgi:hypothetical protein
MTKYNSGNYTPFFYCHTKIISFYLKKTEFKKITIGAAFYFTDT